MKNFKLIEKISSDLIQFMLNEIEFANIWLLNTGRQETIREQSETNSILLRTAKTPIGHEGPVWHIHDSQDDQIDKFPIIANYLNEFTQKNQTTLARAMIVRLKPFGQVYKHYDFGKYYDMRDRFHLVLQSKTGSLLTSGDEAQILKTGELWWFNNSLEHQAFNDSDEWRIHVIFDINSNLNKITSKNVKL